MAVDASRLRRIIREVFGRIRDLRRDLHAHPEMAFAEKRTAQKVCEHLKQLKIPHRTRVGKTGIVALIKGDKPGPCVALRADMDALPMTETNRFAWRSRKAGVMHACGHDGHTANLVGVAHVLSRLREHLRGSVKLIFQPAEESGIQGGAELMVADGALKDPKVDVIFGLHISHGVPLGSISVVAGPALASADFFDVRILGKGAHAAYPHKGVDPIAVAAAAITSLQTIVSRRVDPLQAAVVTVGRINGGTAHNIIPDEVTFGGTTRSYSPSVRKLLHREVVRIPKDVARAMGAAAEVDFLECYPPLINTPKVTGFVQRVATDAIDAEHVQEAVPSMGGEDFSFYLKTTPGVFFWLGNGAPERQIHSGTFNFDDRALRTGMLVMSALALGWATQSRG